MTRKELNKMLEDAAERGHYFQKVVLRKDGTVEFRSGYFYRHGRTAEKFAQKVSSVFPQLTVVESTDERRAWPKTSYFLVKARAAS